jgi:glutamyl-tRNA reductase
MREPTAVPGLTAALITHRRAPLAVLERMPRGAELPSALAQVIRALPVGGAVGLSTCNRFELYLDSTGTPPGRAEVAAALTELTGVPKAVMGESLELVRGPDAVRHLFAVAAGLESRLLGEDEILGQVRTAARTAEQAGTATVGLRSLFEWGVRTGRRARRAAGLVEGRVSLATHAVAVLEQRLGPLGGRTVLLLGSGHMAGRVAAALRCRDARPVVLVRRPGAAPAGGPPVLPLDELPDAIDCADAVLCATSAPQPVLSAALLARAAQQRGGRPPLVVIDLAVPRNVEVPAGRAAGVELLDLDALTEGDAAPACAAFGRRALRVVTEETRAFCARDGQAAAGSLIEQVLRHGEGIRLAEVKRAARLSPSTDPRLLDELTARVLAKVLHAPIAAIREHSGTGEGALAALIAGTLTGGPADVLG